MPAMGSDLGGPLKLHQINDIVNFLSNWDQSLIARAQEKHAVATTSSEKSTEAITEKKGSASSTEERLATTPIIPMASAQPPPESKAETPGQSSSSQSMAPSVLTPSPSAPQEKDVSQGKPLYSSFGCAACHGPDGKGAMGPSLIGKSREEIVQFVRKPRSPVMPPFSPDRLPDEDLNAIIAFIGSLKQ